MQTSTQTIYIPLLDEGTQVWRPTLGELLDAMTFRVLPSENYDPDEEHWQFLPGSIVRCEKMFRHGNENLYAVEEVRVMKKDNQNGPVELMEC